MKAFSHIYILVEKYDPVKDVWISVANMNRKRSGVAVAAFDGKIYAFGGHSKKNYLFKRLSLFIVVLL